MSEIVICEKQGEWAAILRRHYEHIAETRTLDDCLLFIETHPNAVVVVDVADSAVDRIATWIAIARRRQRLALFLVIVPREALDAYSWLREAGAAEILTSFGDMPRVKRIVRRHFDRLHAGPLSLEQRIWNNLPWSPRFQGYTQTHATRQRANAMTNGEMDIAAVKAALREFKDPETGRSVVDLGQARDLTVDDGSISLTLALTTHSAPLWDETIEGAKQCLVAAFPQAKDVTVKRAVFERRPEKIGEIGLTAKSVIAVGSGKGGVGKSTVAAALAYGLQRAGSTVGLVDADVYGPSMPHLLGVSGRPEIQNNRIQPLEKDGIRVMSMGFLVPAGEAVVWRGPMLHGAITQFLRDTEWGDLDHLVIDMPPGTGDIALTLSQLLPLSGAVVVCTPQEVALLDAVKAIAMFRKVNIPILGMVENMSGFVCPGCDKRYDIFGSGGAQRQARELDVPFLGEIPINVGIRISGDKGQMNAVYEDEVTRPYLDHLTHQLATNLAQRVMEDPPLPTLTVL